MPMYHLTVEVEIGGACATIQQVVDLKGSGDAGNVRVDIQRMLSTKESPQLADRRQYVGKIQDMDLILGDVPKPPEPEKTNRREAIRAQKERNGR